MEIVEKLYHEHESLATKYANKLFNFHKLGFEKEDVIQELRIKIFTSIKSHCERMAEFNEGSSPKPIPLEFYLKLALNNKIKDFIGLIEKERAIVAFDSVDFGKKDSDLNIPEGKWEINGVDLTTGLSKRERIVYVSYLKGSTMAELQKKFSKLCNVSKTVKEQNVKLRKLVEKESEEIFTIFSSISED